MAFSQAAQLPGLAIVTISVLLAACPAERPAGTCETHADCSNDSVCVDKLCHKTCNYNRDCLSDEYCLEGACALRPDDAGLSSDADMADTRVTDINASDSTADDINSPDAGAFDHPEIQDGAIPDLIASDMGFDDVNSGPDNFVADAAVPDAIVTDSSLADSAMSDNAVPDTYLPDTSQPDTMQTDSFIDPCGNGILDDGEACDDGNLLDNDGCTPSCNIMDGWHCDNSSGLSFCCIDGEQDNDLDGTCSATCGGISAPVCDHGLCDDSSGTALCVCKNFYEGDICDLCRVFVSTSGLSTNTGASWNESFGDLQQGISKASSLVFSSSEFCEVHLSQGRFSSSLASFNLLTGVHLIGGFAGPGSSSPDDWDAQNYRSTILRTGTTNFAMSVYTEKAVLKGCTFNGSGLDIQNALNLAVDNCFFINAASNNNAAVEIHNSSVSFTYSHFINNINNYHGSAIYTRDSHINIQSSLFTGNASDDMGGAIYVSRGASLSVSHSIFANNISDRHGGAVLINYGTLFQVESSIFVGNKLDYSAGYGAGIMAYDGWAGVFGCTFCYNSATHESAVTRYSSRGGDYSLVNDLIYANKSQDSPVDTYRQDGMTYSLIEGNADLSNHVIDTDPKFASSVFSHLNQDGPVYDVTSGTTTLAINTTTEIEPAVQYFASPVAYSAGNRIPVYGPHYYPVLKIIDDNQRTLLILAGDATDDFDADDELQLHRFDLQPDSPCIDSGDSTYDQPDIDGKARACASDGDSCVDMGAYEYAP